MSVQGTGVPSIAPSSGNRARSWLIPLVLAVLVLLLVLLSARNARPADTQPYELESAGPFGLRALRESLREMGYTVKELRGETFVLPDDGDLLLIWPGQELWSEEDVLALRSWAAQGRTAVLVAAMYYDTQPQFEEWGAEANISYAIGPGAEVNQAQPGMPSSPARLDGSTGATVYDFSQAIVQLSEVGDTEWQATLGVEQVGDGWLWYNTDNHPLTNYSLRTPDQTAVLAAFLRDVPDGGIIYFDAYHLYGPQQAAGENGAGFRTLQEWLYFSPIGRAILFAIVVGAAGWVLAGRRLGPPLKTEKELRRREGAEYVRAIAGLKRRAHAHDEIAQRQAHRLKIAVGKPRRIAATQDDSHFVAALRATGESDPDYVEQIAALLKMLRAAKSEEELVKAAAAVDAFLSK